MGDYESRRRELQEGDPLFYQYLIHVEMADRLRSLHAALGSKAASRVWASAEHHQRRAERLRTRRAS